MPFWCSVSSFSWLSVRHICNSCYVRVWQQELVVFRPIIEMTNLASVLRWDDFWLLSCSRFPLVYMWTFILSWQLTDTTSVLKKRCRAYGVLALGSGTGGTILPILVQQLFDKVGFKWTIRIAAFVLALAVFVANLVGVFHPLYHLLLLTLCLVTFPAPAPIYCQGRIIQLGGLQKSGIHVLW